LLHRRLAIHVDSQKMRANRGLGVLQQYWFRVGRKQVRESGLVAAREFGEGVD
jgi:hypothetical protein